MWTTWIITRFSFKQLEDVIQMTTRKPTHPGEVFFEDVIKPLGLTVTKTAVDLGISRKALSEFINQRANLSAEMAVRIAAATNTSPESWMLMQSKLDLWRVLQKKPKVIKQLQATNI